MSSEVSSMTSRQITHSATESTIVEKKNSVSEALSSAMSKAGNVALKALKVLGAIFGSMVLIPLAFKGFREFASDNLFGTTYAKDKAAIKEEMATPEHADKVARREDAKAGKIFVPETKQEDGTVIPAHYENQDIEVERKTPALGDLLSAKAGLKAPSGSSEEGARGIDYFDPAKTAYVDPRETIEDVKAAEKKSIRAKAEYDLKQRLKQREQEKLAARPTTRVVADAFKQAAQENPVATGIGLGTVGTALLGGAVLLVGALRK